jgi:hypothetical protein
MPNFSFSPELSSPLSACLSGDIASSENRMHIAEYACMHDAKRKERAENIFLEASLGTAAHSREAHHSQGNQLLACLFATNRCASFFHLLHLSTVSPS